MLGGGLGNGRRPGGTPGGGAGGSTSPATPRRSARIAPAAPTRGEAGSAAAGNATAPCPSYRQQLVNASISLWRGSDAGAAASSKGGAEAQTSDRASSSSKKRKRIDARSYFKRFKMAADVVAASPDGAGKENTSSGHASDSNISKICEGGSLIGKNKRHSSDVVCNVPKRLVLGLHETSEARVEQSATLFLESGPILSIACTTLSHPLQQLNGTQQKEGVKKPMSTPENLHVQLKQELSKLIQVLQLPDHVRFMAEQLFEYVLNNHQVVTEPVGVLHAFNIALCWHAASLLNCKVDRKESLALAEKSLNYECNEDLVALIYRKLRTLKEKFPYRAGETSITVQPVSVEDIRLSGQATSTNLENDHMFQNKEMDLHGKFTNGASQEISTVAEQMISERQEPVQETHRECHVPNEKIPYRAGETSITVQPVSVEDIQPAWQETSTNLENDHMFQNKEMDLHGKFTNGASQEISTVAEQMISERQEPVQETYRECHVPNDELPNMIVEKIIDLVDNVFSLREKNILCQQQLEISGLVTYRQNNVIRLKEVCSLVLEHIRRSHIDEMTRRERIKLTAHWFTMLMYAFLEHMKLQHDKLEGLQSDTWSSERQLKENLHQVAKSGQLDQDFDQRIPLADSNFLMEEFIHFKEHNDEYRIVESSVSYCEQSSNAALLMEITLVGNEVLSEPMFIQAMENEPVETCVGSGGGPASEAVDFPENISCSSDGIDVQSAGCSSSTIPSNDDSIGQEASTSECRNSENIKIDNIAKPSILLGGATSLVRGVNSNNDDTLDTDVNHLGSPILASSQSFQSLVGTRAVLPCMSPYQSTDLSAQQNVAPSHTPPVEAEQTGLLDLGTQAVQDLHPEMQPSILFLDAPLQKMLNDRSQTGVQPDRASGLLLRSAATSLHLGDARMQCQRKNDGNIVVDPVLSESPTYPADTLQVSAEVESQTCESSMPAKQRASPPAQQSLPISRHPPAEAELSDTEAAWDLQPELQPSISMQHQPEEAERAGTLGSIAAQGLQPEPQPSTSVQNVPSERTYLSGMPVLQSLSVLQSVGPSLDPLAGIVIAHDLQSEIQPSGSVPAEQSTSLPAQKSLATSLHSPVEAEQALILGTEAACDLQPEVQPSTSMQDEPAEAEEEPVEAERAATLDDIAAQSLQPEMSLTSTQDVPFERSYLSGMPELQSPTIHQSLEPSLDPHAGAEPVGMVTAHDLQSEILPSAPVRAEQSTSLLAQQSLPTLQHSPAEAEPADILGTEPACDLQPLLGEVHDQPSEQQSCILGAIAAQNLHPETQPSTSTTSAPFERTHLFVMPVLQSLTVHHSVEPSLDPHARAESTHTLGLLTAHVRQPEVQPSASMQDRPAEAEVTVMLGSTEAQDLQAELQSSTTVQHVPLERVRHEERRQIVFQPNMVPGLEQPTQRPPVANNPILSDDQLKNELDTLMHCKSLLSKDHEHKKALLLIECNQEIEKVKKKYASLLQKEDSTYLQTQRDLTDIYKKVFAHKSLAENFRAEMTPSAAAQGRSTSPVMEQPFESSSVAETAASPVISSPSIRLPGRNSAGSYVRPSSADQQPSSTWNAQPQSILPGNVCGTASSALVPAPAPRGSNGPAGAQSCDVQPQSVLPSNVSITSPVPPAMSAPRLQLHRMPWRYAVRTDQQQLPAASPGVTSLGQHAPVIMAAKQLSYPNIALDSTCDPPNTAPGSQQHSGAQIAGGSESASLNAYLPARLGLRRSQRLAGASPEVACHSNDE